MKIRWTGGPRGLTDPQAEVATGDIIEVDDATAASLVEQGHAEPADTKAAKKEND